MLRLLTTTAIVAVGLLACPPVFAQTRQPNAGASAKNVLDQEDKNFVKEATIGGMAEIELSKIAQKSENADVEHFADRMVDDKAVKLFRQEERSGRNAELKQFAQKTLPTLEEHQKMALELSRKLSQTAAR
jgi:putative membrane protein